VNSPRNRKGESVNPPPNANASEFYPNQNPHSKEWRSPFWEIGGRGSEFRTEVFCYFCDLPEVFAVE